MILQKKIPDFLKTQKETYFCVRNVLTLSKLLSSEVITEKVLSQMGCGAIHLMEIHLPSIRPCGFLVVSSWFHTILYTP